MFKHNYFMSFFLQFIHIFQIYKEYRICRNLQILWANQIALKNPIHNFIFKPITNYGFGTNVTAISQIQIIFFYTFSFSLNVQKYFHFSLNTCMFAAFF